MSRHPGDASTIAKCSSTAVSSTSSSCSPMIFLSFLSSFSNTGPPHYRVTRRRQRLSEPNRSIPHQRPEMGRPSLPVKVPTVHVIRDLSLRCADRLIRRPHSESRRAVDVPRHAARTHYAHAHPLHYCMVVSTDLGLSCIPRIRTHG
ncbi:hypothetical protein ARMGADRAFT_96158 [Armillaria gallica]|uniref:Uncharacterized protein n=1 Tax=Armillaria gallica TaxID=47427 RepID=A0A2H3CLD8_ARMGA|nr:hypothetical protein ARMGADRAFT_96158 [Armillaria gallica]